VYKHHILENTKYVIHGIQLSTYIISYSKRAPYEGNKSATLISKSYEYRAIQYVDKTIRNLDR